MIVQSVLAHGNVAPNNPKANGYYNGWAGACFKAPASNDDPVPGKSGLTDAGKSDEHSNLSSCD
jgi:hypothetical protein